MAAAGLEGSRDALRVDGSFDDDCRGPSPVVTVCTSAWAVMEPTAPDAAPCTARCLHGRQENIVCNRVAQLVSHHLGGIPMSDSRLFATARGGSWALSRAAMLVNGRAFTRTGTCERRDQTPRSRGKECSDGARDVVWRAVTSCGCAVHTGTRRP